MSNCSHANDTRETRVCIYIYTHIYIYINLPSLMIQNLCIEKSTLVPLMAWCRQAAIYCMCQRWLRSMSPYGVTMPEWALTRNMWKFESRFQFLFSMLTYRFALKSTFQFLYVSNTHWTDHLGHFKRAVTSAVFIRVLAFQESLHHDIPSDTVKSLI